MGILAEPAGDLEADDAEQGLAEYASAHLGCTEFAVHEYNGYLLDLESALVGGKLHLNLEGVTLKVDLVQFYGLQNLAAVALESGGGVVHGQTGHDVYVLGCKI